MNSISERERENKNSSKGDSRRETMNSQDLSVPRGGPIYTPNLVSPLIGVTQCQTSFIRELQVLEEELQSASSTLSDEDISIDDLKVFSEEELLDMALKEETIEDVEKENLLPDQIGSLSNSNKSKGSRLRVVEEGGNASALVPCSKTQSAKKRKREKNCNDENSLIEKVAGIVKIKQKQEQARAAVKLHSLSPRRNTNESAIPSSEKAETMKSLKSKMSMAKELQVKSLIGVEHPIVQYPEVVLSVEVYHNIRKSVKTQEFLVLGRQKLTELRDKIYCLTDRLMSKAEQHDSSGYFLVEDVFCNDLRHPFAIDYSQPIFDWLRNSKKEAHKKWEWIVTGELQQKQKAVLGGVPVSNFPNLQAVDMEKLRFCDLRFRLGAGYLYCHQGDCNHTIIIRDMRMIHPEDVQDPTLYPISTFQLKFRVQKCNVCKIFSATKVTVDDKWAQENPCYFCEDCYFLLHYSKEGTLLYNDFLMYEYLHD